MNQFDKRYLEYLKQNRRDLMAKNPLPEGFWTEEFGVKQFQSHLTNQERISQINYLADAANEQKAERTHRPKASKGQ